MPKGYKNESPSKILNKNRRSDQIPMGSNRQGKSINNAGKIAEQNIYPKAFAEWGFRKIIISRSRYSALQITRKMG